MIQFTITSESDNIYITPEIWYNTFGHCTIRLLSYTNSKGRQYMQNNITYIYLTPAEHKRLQTFEKRYRNAARDTFTRRVAYYHQLTGGNYTSITIRDQKSRWGSCSSRGTLSFNYRLIFAPQRVLDYVVVHELCHLTHMNHSKNFWHMVEKILPEYKESKKWLREHGQELNLIYYLEKQGIPIKL